MTLTGRFPFDATTEHRSRTLTPRIDDSRRAVLVKFTITRRKSRETCGEDEGTIDGTAEFCLDRRGARGDVRRIRSGLHIDPDAEDDGGGTAGD